ncbi:hypothetical protein ABIC80_001316 [Kosakonia sp. 1610]
MMKGNISFISDWMRGEPVYNRAKPSLSRIIFRKLLAILNQKGDPTI